MAHRVLYCLQEKDQAEKVEKLKKSEASVELTPRGFSGSNERRLISLLEKAAEENSAHPQPRSFSLLFTGSQKSCKTRSVNRPVLTVNSKRLSAACLINPIVLNLLIKCVMRDRVVPTISARVS